MNDNKLMNRAADNIRILAASMVEKANSGHPGGAMGGADFVNVLFSEFLVYDPENPRWEGRDRFFLDPGHMSPMLYSTLALTGKFTLDELKEFRQWGSPTPGHPEVDIMRGIENTSGPLGQGHTFAVGAAIAAKFLKARFNEVMNQTIYAYISDGGIQEEISQGSGRIAGALGLDNLIMFYDSNDIQLSTETKDVTVEDTAMKYEAWGWNVLSINGNDPDEIRAAIKEAQAEKERPTLIIGKTVMGKGARKADGSSYEANCATHGAPLGGDAYVNTIKNLGGDPTNPFVIFSEVAELYAKRAAELKEIVRMLNQVLVYNPDSYAWLLLARASGMQNDMATSNYAAAEFSFLGGDAQTARRQAENALRHNPSSTLRLKIDDLLMRIKQLEKEEGLPERRR